MYTASVETGFRAVHSVRMPDGTLETPHVHDWHVRAHFAGPVLDAHDMVVDFCAALSALESAAAELAGRDLNALSQFAGHSPTAERVARLIFDRLQSLGWSRLRRVEVCEAPGCVAAYEPCGASAFFDDESAEA